MLEIPQIHLYMFLRIRAMVRVVQPPDSTRLMLAEVMVYLSYIIENYDKLADVNIFMHAHRLAWHNNELLDHDAVQVIARLSAERVQREGYV